MTSPYSPDTAQALAFGATSAGWVTSSPPSWDDGLRYWNIRGTAERAQAEANDARAALAALRAELRAALGVTTAGVKILCVGDSITIGAGSSDGQGYRSRLADLLDRRRITAEVSMLAVAATTLRVLAPQVPAALAAHNPDIVLVGFGTNDAAQPDLTDYATRLGALVDQILASAPTVKVAVSRPALSNAAYASNEILIGGYVDQVVTARQVGGRVVAADMTVVDCSWTVDGVHPQDAGYLRMAQQWAAVIGPWLPAVS